MAPSAIAAYARFYQPGVTKVYFVASIATVTAPTRPELDAGIDLTRQVEAITGFQISAAEIATPDYASLFTSNIPGRTSVANSSLTIYVAKNGVDVRSTLARGTTGNIVMLDGGDVTGYKMDVFPVTVKSIPKQRGDTKALTVMVDFSFTAAPAEDVAIP